MISLIFFSLLVSGISAQGKQGAEYNDDADYAQVTSVRMVETQAGTYTIHVTVSHNDQGWDHYADRWQVVDADTGEIIAERILAHPHDNEQPFTRSKSDIVIPENTTRIIVRARCTRHGFKGKQITIDFTEPSGRNYYIEEIEIIY